MNFRTEIREKTVEISGVLSCEGLDIPVINNITTAAAKNWAYFCTSNNDMPCRNVHLIPHPLGWALLASSNSDLVILSESKEKSVKEARAIAKGKKLKLFIHSEEGLIEDCECFLVNMPKVAAMRKPVSTQKGWLKV
ncbi:MAG: DUF2188 domain-containing protein [Cytophagaceae bacterium]